MKVFVDDIPAPLDWFATWDLPGGVFREGTVYELDGVTWVVRSIGSASPCPLYVVRATSGREVGKTSHTNAVWLREHVMEGRLRIVSEPEVTTHDLAAEIARELASDSCYYRALRVSCYAAHLATYYTEKDVAKLADACPSLRGEVIAARRNFEVEGPLKRARCSASAVLGTFERGERVPVPLLSKSGVPGDGGVDR